MWTSRRHLHKPMHEIAWCPVPGGRFSRGSDASPDEQPVLEVLLSPYRLSKYPVTNADFHAFIEASGYDDPRWWSPIGWQQRRAHGWTCPNYWHSPPWNREDAPVTGVSFWEALAYARWAGASLPTEAQWEYAAKGPEGRTYPWGEDEPTLDLANFAPDCQPVERAPTPVRAHPRGCSPFGCMDMAGNFAEWCLDNARPSYRGDLSLRDPVYITSEEDGHIVRGGAGLHDAGALRCTARDYYAPGLRDNLIGIRLAAGEAHDGR